MFIPYFCLLVFDILVPLEFSCVIFFSFFCLAHFALQNVNKDYVIFLCFCNFITKSDQKPKTKNGMNETVVTKFVKICNELVLCPIGRPGLFVKSQCLSFSIVTRIEYYVSKLKKVKRIHQDPMLYENYKMWKGLAGSKRSKTFGETKVGLLIYLWLLKFI